VLADDGLVRDPEVLFDALFDQAGFGHVGEAAEEFEFAAVGEGGQEVVAVRRAAVPGIGAALFAVELADGVGGERAVARPGERAVVHGEFVIADGEGGGVEEAAEGGVGQADADGDVADREDLHDPRGVVVAEGHRIPEDQE